ncbi:hypothetical protein [Thorsellia anophelis]|uniref:hypothetical protein n=1 Tax=Thorsellia anophelis TaxID=336804 RepID=UPI000B844F9B|nr:hypothetical protein [Thorsellia anophelis]
MSIISDQRSAISDQRSFLTNLNVLTHLTLPYTSHKKALSSLRTNQNRLICLNSALTKYKVTPTGLAIVLYPHLVNDTENPTNRIEHISNTKLGSQAIAVILDDPAPYIQSETVNTTKTKTVRYYSSWLRIPVPVNQQRTKLSRKRILQVADSAFK